MKRKTLIRLPQYKVLHFVPFSYKSSSTALGTDFILVDVSDGGRLLHGEWRWNTILESSAINRKLTQMLRERICVNCYVIEAVSHHSANSVENNSLSSRCTYMGQQYTVQRQRDITAAPAAFGLSIDTMLSSTVTPKYDSFSVSIALWNKRFIGKV